MTPEHVAEWQTWIGRTETRAERLDLEALRRFAATLGESLDVERNPPSLGHWAFFLPVAAADAIGEDGHPARGSFLPPIDLPRRMFAAGAMRFGAPIVPGRTVERRSTVVDVVAKTGRSGALVLVEVEHVLTQNGEAAVTERQTLVYRDVGDPVPPVVAVDHAPAGATLWEPRTVDLFRFSAVTFNGHRIHYDRPYATQVEGYSDLVIHGPFTAARLYALAAGGRRPTRFAFRASAPLFAGAPVALIHTAAGEVAAVRCDGVTAMTATMSFGDD